jgi:hypothetical protein
MLAYSKSVIVGKSSYFTRYFHKNKKHEGKFFRLQIEKTALSLPIFLPTNVRQKGFPVQSLLLTSREAAAWNFYCMCLSSYHHLSIIIFGFRGAGFFVIIFL